MGSVHSVPGATMPECPADTRHLESSSVPSGAPDGWRWLSSPDLGGSRQTQGAQAWETELFQSTTSWDSDLTWICRQFDESWWNKIKITENRQNLLCQFGQRSQSSKRRVGRQPGGWGPERKAGKHGSAGYQLFVLGQVTTLDASEAPFAEEQMMWTTCRKLSRMYLRFLQPGYDKFPHFLTPGFTLSYMGKNQEVGLHKLLH